DRRAGSAQSPRRYHGVGGLGPDHVLDRLSALGFRRSRPGVRQAEAGSRAEGHAAQGQRPRVVRPGMSRRVWAKAGEVEPGTCKIVTAMGREIGIFNIGGEYYALSNRCPHMGAELCKGWIVGLVEPGEPGEYKLVRRGEFIRCPWHGWEF